jgi:hypothetical protein
MKDEAWVFWISVAASVAVLGLGYVALILSGDWRFYSPNALERISADGVGWGVKREEEGDVQPNRETIEDLKQRYGYKENEAETAYYLMEARARFTKIYRDEAEEEAEESGGMPKL